jgi:hypothetical protein
MSRLASPRKTNEGDGQSSGVDQTTDDVDLLEFLPSGLLEVMLRSRWWEVEQDGAGHAQESENQP